MHTATTAIEPKHHDDKGQGLEMQKRLELLVCFLSILLTFFFKWIDYKYGYHHRNITHGNAGWQRLLQLVYFFFNYLLKTNNDDMYCDDTPLLGGVFFH